MADLSRISVSGMAAQQRQIDLIANNIANAETVGFKQFRLHFEDRPYRPLREVLPEADQPGVPVEWRVGEGVEANATHRMFWQGQLNPTDDPLHVAIVGPGFFQVQLDNGTIAYTRDGSFTLDANRRIVTTDGHPVLPGATIPEGAYSVSIYPDGSVWAAVGDDWQQVGAIELVAFRNPAGLLAIGSNLLQPTAASGPPLPAEGGLDSYLAGGMLEASNVDLADQMTRLIQAQRAYQANLKAYQTWDELLRQASDLSRA